MKTFVRVSVIAALETVPSLPNVLAACSSAPGPRHSPTAPTNSETAAPSVSLAPSLTWMNPTGPMPTPFGTVVRISLSLQSLSATSTEIQPPSKAGNMRTRP